MNPATLTSHFILENYVRRRFGGSFAAVSLFVDVVGFTGITEALARYGQRSSEALAEVMSTIFDPLVRCVYEQKGFITHFGGDAFTALFPGSDVASYQRALAAAWAIRSHLLNRPCYTTPYGEFILEVKIGLAAGDVEWGILQAPEGLPHAYYFRGAAIAGCTQAEHRAQGGDVVLGPSARAVLQPLILTRPVQAKMGEPVGSYVLVTAVRGTLPAPAAIAPPDSLALSAAAADFWPPTLNRLACRGEYRNVVTLFLGLKDVESRGQLETFMETVFYLQREYGGFLSRIDFGDKGCTVLFFWGAPTSHENDVERALNFALDLKETAPFLFRAGITYRVAYAGFVGSALRADYVCYAQGTNLAARMMMAAEWGQIWLDDSIARRVSDPTRRGGTGFMAEPAGRAAFTGFAKQQAVHLLQRRRAQETQLFEGRMVGRQRELYQLAAAIRPMFDGRSAGIVTVIGEAGIGKSRLLHEFRVRTTRGDSATSPKWFHCPTDEIHRQSLNPFRQFLRTYFHQVSGDVQNRARFTRKLESVVDQVRDPVLQKRLARARPFLGALVGLHWPGSLYEQLEPKLRFENTLAALRTLFVAESRIRPVILEVEDAHWLDDDSEQFLQRFVHGLIDQPIVLLVVGREPLLALLVADVPQRTLQLASLTVKEIEELAAARLSSPVSATLVRMLAERTDGNPFFAEQLLRYLEEEELLLEVGGSLTLDETDRCIPTDVRAVLIARLDRLSPDMREMVQAAAVLGREFEVPVLARMMEYSPAKVKVAADEGIWSKLTETRYMFRHALLRDAAYDVQSKARLQAQHRLAAVALENVYAKHLAPHYADLVYHYGKAGDGESERYYARLTGEQAAAQFANAEAVSYLGRALALAPEEDYTERYALLLAREKVYDLQGQRMAQLRDLMAMRELADVLGDDHRLAQVALRRADYAETTGDFPTAIVAAQEAVRFAKAIQDVACEAGGYLRRGRVLHHQGKYAAARDELEKALILAREAGLRQVEANCLRRLGAVVWYHGSYGEAAAYLRDALRIFRQVGDRRGESRALGNLGGISSDQGDYVKARSYQEQVLLTLQEMGDRQGEMMSLNNLGEVSMRQGDYDEAREHFERALRIGLEINDRRSEGIVRGNLGFILLSQGFYLQARICFERALGLFREIGDRSGDGWILFLLGLLFHQERDDRAAHNYSQQALCIAHGLGDLYTKGRALTCLGHALARLGKLSLAAAAYREALALRRTLGEQGGALEALAGLARVSLAQGDSLQAHAQVEDILGSLENNAKALDGAEEPFRVYLTCYQVLLANQDPRASDLLNTANRLLWERAAKISDKELQRSFLEGVAVHQEIIREHNRNLRECPSYPRSDD